MGHVLLHILEHLWVQLDQVVLEFSLFLNPWVLKCFLRGETHIGGPLEQLTNQILGIVGDRVPHLTFETILSVQHVVDNIFVLFAAEWWFTTQHDKHDDSHGPNIALRRVASLENFRCNIVWRAIRLVHHLVGIDTLGQTKVNQFDVTVIVLLVEEKVFWLDVTMANMVSVQVAQGIKGLLHDGGSLLLAQVLLFSNVIEQLAAFAQLCDEETDPLGLPRLE